MVDFYARTDLITTAVTAELALRADDADRDTAELTALATQITTTRAAIDRYLTAFENGALDERTCGLTTRLDQLTLRRDELTDLIQTPPAPPSPQAIAALRERLAEVITHGTPGQRKALIETHIAEITLDRDTLTPIFLVPTDGHQDDEGGPTGTPASPAFRTPRQVVREAGLEPARLKAQEPKSCVAASYTTPALRARCTAFRPIRTRCDGYVTLLERLRRRACAKTARWDHVCVLADPTRCAGALRSRHLRCRGPASTM